MPEIAIRDALREAIDEELAANERVIVMGEDVGAYGGSYSVTKGLLEKYGPDRIIDTPIAELGFVGTGIGAAMSGLRPMVEIMTINFSLLALDQIINSASKIHYMSGGQVSVPIVIRMASGAGLQLAAQHSHSFEPWYASIPGVKVVTPSNAYDAKGLLKTAFKDENPVIFIEFTAIYGMRGEVPEGEYYIPFGKAKIARPGKDVTIVSYGGGVINSLNAAKQLEQEGVDAEVIDLRTLRPLDIDTVIESVKKTNRAVVVEHAWRTGGFAAEIASQIQEAAFDYLDAPIARAAGADVPMPYAGEMERAAMVSDAQVVEAVKSVL